MGFPKDDNEFDQTLSEAFAPPPSADFDAWQQQHPEAIAYLNPQRTAILLKRRRTVSRTIVFATTAAIAICVWLGLSHFDTTGMGASVFAQTVEQIKKAKTVMWKETNYDYATIARGEADKKTWLISNTMHYFYKSPGLSRTEGANGTIFINNTAKGEFLLLDANKKHAVITKSHPATTFPIPVVGWVSKALSERDDLQWVGKRTMPTREVNIFRYTEKLEFSRCNWSTDIWIDAKTKQLVEVHLPGADIFDLETDPLRDNPPGGQGFSTKQGGSVLHDIVLDAELDDSLFSLQPPEGYTVEVRSCHVMTEQEMLDYLDAVTDFNDQTFPDQILPNISALRFDNAHLDEVRRKSENDRTSSEKKLLHAIDNPPGEELRAIDRFGYFINDSVLPGTFRYLGKGVKLGDKDRIVCWYKLKNAKNPDTYRVVYGDLSVKDVAPENLPLPVGP